MRTHLVLISLLSFSLIGCNPSVEPQAAEQSTSQFGIVMEFELPDEGAATQLNLLQGGQNLPAPRIESSLNKEDG